MRRSVVAAKEKASEEDEDDDTIVASARVDIFPAIYARCTEIGELLSNEAHGLYGLRLFKRDEILMVRRRLGRLRVWDLTRCDEEELIAGNVSRSTIRRERMLEADSDSQRMQKTLQEYFLKDDPTSRGYANKYVMDLSIFEDWQCAFVLLQVEKQSQGEHFDEPFWSEKAAAVERGSRWLVPGEWHNQLPTIGIFTVPYLKIDREGCRDIDFREELAKKYLGW